MSSHSIIEEKTLDDGTVLYRCSDCGMTYKNKGAFKLYACKSITESRETADEKDHAM